MTKYVQYGRLFYRLNQPRQWLPVMHRPGYIQRPRPLPEQLPISTPQFLLFGHMAMIVERSNGNNGA